MTRRLTVQQRIFCFLEISKGTAYSTIQQLWRARYPADPLPSYRTLYDLKHKLIDHGTAHNRQRDGSGAPRTGLSLENALATLESITNDPTISIRRRSAMIGILRTTLHRILRTELKFYPYQITKRHELQPQDPAVRLRCADWFIAKDQADDDFLDTVLWGDEVIFNLTGAVNSHNATHWGTERPDQVQQIPLHSPKLVVWCAISSHGVIGPYFLKDQNGVTTTVNSDRYLHMLKRFFIPELYNLFTDLDLDPFKLHFMQDGARAHITRPVRHYLEEQFENRTIGEHLPQHWSARSPDLTPCDSFMWGHMKEEVYKRMPFADLNALEAAICDVVRRFEEVKNRGGRHIEHLL